MSIQVTVADVDNLHALIAKALNPAVAEEQRKTAALHACELVNKMGIVNSANIAQLKKFLPMLNMMLAAKK